MTRRAAQRELHQAADALGPRLARAILKGLTAVRERVSISDLAAILNRAQMAKAQGRPWKREVEQALALLPAKAIEAALAPAGTVAREAFARGGKLGAAQVNRARRAA